MSLGQTLLSAVNKASLLQCCPICASLGDDALAPISKMAVEKRFEKGAFLANEGDPCAGFYLVLEGKVRVYKTSASGKDKVLLIAETGMTFGESALFGDGHFHETAEAQTPVRALLIPRSDFLGLLHSNPSLAFQVMESLCLWIQRLSTSVENIAFLGAKDRLVNYLVGLAGGRTGTLSLTLPDKKKDIAATLGITPETFSRVMKELERLGYIAVDNAVVTIKDVESLREELPE